MIKLFKKENRYFLIIFLIGFIIRIVLGLMSSPRTFFQHDVLPRYGHYDYAVYIFKYWSLSFANYYEFAHPPLNAIMQAVAMKIGSFFQNVGDDYMALYENAKYLNIFYSIATLYVVYKIANVFDIKNSIKRIIFTIITFYPGILVLATQYDNDPIAFLFFFLSIYYAILWSKSYKLKDIVKLAISIGLAMLSKLSMAVLAFIIGPIMILVLIRSIINSHKSSNILVDRETLNIIRQLFIFAIIVFPLGLSYSIRNMILFSQPLGEIPDMAAGSTLDLARYQYTIVDRFLSFPLSGMTTKRYGIFKNVLEYNVWMGLYKTATFDDFNYIKIKHTFVPGVILLILNGSFFLLSIISFFYILIDTIKTTCNAISNKCINQTIKNDDFNIKNLSIVLIVISLVFYIIFNLRYAYTCSSNYRYILYITLGQSIQVAYFLTSILVKNK